MKRYSLIQIFLKLTFTLIGLAASFLIINPFLPSLKIFWHRINPSNIASNAVTYIFSQLNQEELQKELEKQNNDTTSLEHVTSDQIDKFIQEQGNIYTVEDKDTQLIIKSVDIKGKVVDGKDSSALDKGFWFYPLSHPFGEKGKSIIIAHRFQYIPPRTDTFFNLDKVKIGDKVIIKQKDTEYIYRVINIKIVKKNKTEILQTNVDKGPNKLILITCTPLWTAKQRLVVTAQLEYKSRRI